MPPFEDRTEVAPPPSKTAPGPIPAAESPPAAPLTVTRLFKEYLRPSILLPYLGPAFIVSVGYMDPGNWATDIDGGACLGYTSAGAFQGESGACLSSPGVTYNG